MVLSLFKVIVPVYSARTINWQSIGIGLLKVKLALKFPEKKKKILT
jgi:hypothetical protein